MRSLLTSFFVFCFCANSLAVPVALSVQNEIDLLMAQLQTSGCEFSRNGSWYTGIDAKRHLLQKLNYLKNESTVKSTEQFIDLTASASSVSGKPYMVRCGGAGLVESQKWFLSQLKNIRAFTQPAASSPK